MKIYLINPKFPVTFLGQEYASQIVGKRYTAPPLPLLTIAGNTPRTFNLEFCDENTHSIRWKTDAEVIALTGMHLQRRRMREIATTFRALGKRIVIGGPSVTAMPEWYRPVADVLIRGEAEYIWPQFLGDLAAGAPQLEYHETRQVDLRDSPTPRYDLVELRHYSYVGVQATRGCPFSCEFCDIISLYGRTVRTKPVERVVEEVERILALGARRIYFVDDNFTGDRRYVYELLEALQRLAHGLRHPPMFSCQTTVNVARDRTLLRLMHEAGMRTMFIGIETPRVASLVEAQKYQNTRIDLHRAVETVQSHGIMVSVGTMVGFDHDDASIFDEQVDFITKTRVTMILPNQLVALPGTPLYERLRRAGRLREGDEWRADGQYIESNFVPHQMTAEQLSAGYTSMLLRLYEPRAYARRLLDELSRLDRAGDVSRSVWSAFPVICLGFGWVLMWYAVDRHRYALLRAFWSSVPTVLVRLRRVAGFALMRLVQYRHIYRLTQSWEAARLKGQEPSQRLFALRQREPSPVRIPEPALEEPVDVLT